MQVSALSTGAPVCRLYGEPKSALPDPDSELFLGSCPGDPTQPEGRCRGDQQMHSQDELPH